MPAPKLNFKYKVTLVAGMRLTTVRINAATHQKPTQGPDYITEGELEASIFGSTVAVSLWGIGNPYLKGTFNITQNGKKLFAEDQELIVGDGGRFRFYKKEVKIPA